ncbi:cytosine permease [Leifsonia sp. NPDC056824]|uniref:purine-cytosine permease family protein n=1 Tax=Leifsonia sp. NPDC056824 TaxID=3345953 RepID=UPI0036CCE45C
MERADDVKGNGVAEPGGARHSDDELADALQVEVDRATAAIPIIAGPLPAADGVAGADGADGAAALSDAEVTAIVDADLRIHDTFGAIQHLQNVLQARATAAIPLVGEPADDAEEQEEQEDEEDGWVGPPTQLISFDDLPSRRRDDGPQPTYSAWVGAAVPQPPVPEPPAPPAVLPPVQQRPEVSPPKFPTIALDTSTAAPQETPAPETSAPRVEPLGLVPAEYAPSDSQPVPLLPADIHAALPVALEAPLVGAKPAPVAGNDLGPATAPDHIDGDDAHSAPTPVASPRPPEDSAAPHTAPVAPPAFVPETVDLEPTPFDRRAGRASRLFWLWFAGTSSLISVGVGATLFLLGLSLRQLLVATLFGVALSFLPLGLGTLAGKWSGQPTMVVSRAIFGLRGNALPTALALVTKLFWGAVLLWLAGSAAGSLAVSEGWSHSAAIPTAIALVVTIAAAGVVAFFGYGLVSRVQLVLTIASAVLIGVTVAATWRHVDLSRALAIPDALWTHVVTGAVLVFSYVGLAWAMSSAEVARYQRRRSSGAAGMLWATFGAGVPPFVLVSYGGLLAASDPRMAAELASDPVGGFVRLGLPAWYPVPLLLAVGLSLISALVLTIYSGGFTLDALGVRLGRRWSTVVIGAVIAVAGVVLAFTVSDLDVVIRGIPTALSVPVAAWAGLFAGEMMLRTRRFHHGSLLNRGGVYPDWRWANLTMLVVASAIGLGFVSSPLPWLAWEGYLVRLLGADPGIGASNVGVLLALGIGLVTPMVSGVREVRRQEAVVVA